MIWLHINDVSIEVHLRPALEDFFAWINAEAEISLPKTKYGQALEYAQKQKDKVMRVREDDRLAWIQ